MCVCVYVHVVVQGRKQYYSVAYFECVAVKPVVM